MKRAKTVLWARDPETVVMADVPVVSGRATSATSGQGTILFSQLIFQDRVNKSGENMSLTGQFMFFEQF